MKIQKSIIHLKAELQGKFGVTPKQIFLNANTYEKLRSELEFFLRPYQQGEKLPKNPQIFGIDIFIDEECGEDEIRMVV